jgi:hypothetical protein
MGVDRRSRTGDGLIGASVLLVKGLIHPFGGMLEGSASAQIFARLLTTCQL